MNQKTDYLHLFTEVASWTLLSIFAFLIIVSVLSNVNLGGSYHSFLVQSGSMEPTIHTGDVIIVQPQHQYQANDTITFQENSRKVTHRIVEISNQPGKTYFSTKGDANRAEDNALVSADKVIGKVVLTIPRLGFAVVFSKSLPGLILFIFLPALLIIFDEIRKIRHYKKAQNS
jgi:signal peptidase